MSCLGYLSVQLLVVISIGGVIFGVTFWVISKCDQHFGGHFWQEVQRAISSCEQRVFGTISPDPPDLPGLPTLAPVPGQGNRTPAFRMTLVGRNKLPQLEMT